MKFKNDLDLDIYKSGENMTVGLGSGDREIRITNVTESVVAELRRYADELESGKIILDSISAGIETKKDVKGQTMILIPIGIRYFTLRYKEGK